MPQTRQNARSRKTSTKATSEDTPPLKKTRLSSPKESVDVGDEGGTHLSTKSAKSEVSENMKLLPRISSPWKVGAHVSASGGVENAVLNAATIGANAFALFLKSQRKWVSPPLSDKSIKAFKEKMAEHGYSPDVVLPHGSYLINLGNPDVEKREKSYECFLDDLKRCELLGLKLYNFHPGSTVGAAKKDECISFIAQCINRAHSETTYVVTVIENMAGAGNVIGSDFEDLKGIIDQVEDKARVGVCLDTCHSFAAGYDLRTQGAWNETLSKFDEQVGLSYLRGMHLNDSKMDLNSKKDRHENIGLGFLGLGTFRHVLNDVRVQNIPLILETPSFERPSEVWGKEIAILQQLSQALAEPEAGKGALSSVAGKARTDKHLVEVIRSAVKSVEGGAKRKKPNNESKGKKTTKRKRKEESSDGDKDELSD